MTELYFIYLGKFLTKNRSEFSSWNQLIERTMHLSAPIPFCV
jgi:hypothetical protein